MAWIFEKIWGWMCRQVTGRGEGNIRRKKLCKLKLSDVLIMSSLFSTKSIPQTKDSEVYLHVSKGYIGVGMGNQQPRLNIK